MNDFSLVEIELEFEDENLVWIKIPKYNELLKFAKKRNKFNDDFFKFYTEKNKKIKTNAYVTMSAQNFDNLLIYFS